MSRTYRKLKNRKDNKKSTLNSYTLNKTVVKRNKITDKEADDSIFMTIIKNGYRQKVEIKEAIWGNKVNRYKTNLLSDSNSGENSLPKRLRRTKEKEYRACCKNSLIDAIKRDNLEDYVPEDIRIVEAAWSWW